MKSLGLGLVMLLLNVLPTLGLAQTVIWQDNFENATTPDIAAGSTRAPENNGGTTTSYFKRTNNTATDISLAAAFGLNYAGMSGSFIWAGEDHDTPFGLGNEEQQIEWTNINILGQTSISFKGQFAANNVSGAWDNGSITGGSDPAGPSGSNDYIIVEYAIDAGAYQRLYLFIGDATVGVGFKTLREDTNNDGIGDGAQLNINLAEFTKAIPGTGTTMKIRIRARSNGGNEEWAIDNFRLETAPSCTPPSITCPGTQTLVLNSSCQAFMPDYTSLGTAVGGTCGPMTIVQASPAVGSLQTGPGALTVTMYAQNTALQGSTNTCTFTVNKTSPEINVLGNATSIVDGDVTPSLTDFTDFGSVNVSSNIVRTYTISNLGTANLTLAAGSITMTGADASMFVVGGITLPATVLPGQSTTFTVTFTPTSAGLKSATVNIANNDCDEGLYDYAVQGTGVALAEINIQGNAANILDGDVTPSLTDHTDFGSQSVCTGTITRTFTIQNLGGATLTISGSALSGANAADFSISASPPATIASGGSGTFQITFNPSASGLRSATITITNNDTDEGVYDFAIQGTGIDPEINVVGNSLSIVDGDVSPTTADHTDFGSVLACSGTIVRTFTIQNTGSSPLTISGAALSGTHAADYAITTSASPSVAAGASTTVVVTFDPSAAGLRTATLTINNNDCDEAVYDFAIQGTGNADVMNPSITCPSNISINNVVGTCANTATYTAPVGTDNCPSVTTAQIAGLASGASFPVGVTTNTFRATDGAGNTATCSFTVTVVDNQLPTITCPVNQSVNAQPSSCSATVTYVTPVGTDNCPGVTTLQTAGLASGSTFVGGVTTNTFRATDASGNTASCSFTVTVVDNQPPTITCSPNLTAATAVGQCNRQVFFSSPTTNDNCGPNVTVQTGGLASGATFPIGVTTNTFRVTDGAGNTATCSFTVTVVDMENPTISCPANINTVNTTGLCGAAVTFTTPVGADNCPSVTTTQTSGTASGTVFPVGVTTNTFRATDGAGNTASCSFTVTVLDTQNPTISCPANISTGTTSGQCAAVVTYAAPVGTDNCSGATTALTTGLASGSTFPVGVSTVVYRVTDAAGNTATCSFTVTVVDNQGPTLATAPCNTSNATGAAYANGWQSGDNDGTGFGPWSLVPSTGNTSQAGFFVGSSTQNGAALDANADGDINTANQALGLYANSSQGAQATRTILGTFGLGSSFSIEFDNGFVDPGQLVGIQLKNTTGQSLGELRMRGGQPTYEMIDVNGITPFTGIPFTDEGLIIRFTSIGVGQVALTVTRKVNGATQTLPMLLFPGGGNQVPGGFMAFNSNAGIGVTNNVYVNSMTACLATAGCPSNISVNNTTGQCGAVVAYTTPVALDNCSGSAVVTQTSGLATGATFPVGTTTNTFLATDGSGNTSTCSFTVTVNDTQLPTITCPANASIFSPSGQCNAPFTYTVGNSDNCPGLSLIQLAGVPSGGTFNAGTTTNTFRATDAAGNTATCSFTVTVSDTVAPTAICQNITLQLNGSGTANVLPVMVNGGSNDNCGISSTSASPSMFTCSNIGSNAVTLVVTDNSGNTATCLATVTVEDTVAPVANCQNVTTYLSSGGASTIVPSMANNGSTDNCAITSTTLSTSTFTCAHIGTNTVIFTASDASGNTATCSFAVAVFDTVSPFVACQNITVFLGGAGTATIVPAMVRSASSDACGINNSFVSPSLFTCANIGANSVVLTVNDVNSNASTCSATVTVVDSTAPAAICQNLTVYLNGTGTASISTGAVNGGSSDACGIQSLSVNPSAFTCSNLGTNTVVLTAADPSGNTSTCASVVTVQDSTAPTAICQNVTVALNGAGNGSTTAAAVNNGSSDACGGTTLSLSNSSFTCANVGANTVILTVADNAGNTATCSATATVVDNVAPIASCRNVTVNLDNAGNGSTTGAAVNNISSDACGIGSLAVSPSSFNCTNIGSNTVILTVTDVNGNTSTCGGNATVRDLIAPVAVCQNVTVQLNSAGAGSVLATSLNGGSTDACGISGFSIVGGTYTCANIGSNSLVLTVTDVNGNTSTCTSTVVVVDLIAPTAVCQAVTVQLDAAGNGSTTAAAVNNGSSDACGIASLSLNNTTFSCSNVGANTVVLTVSDNNGNTSTCSGTVTVQDITAPTAICRNASVSLNATGNGSTTVAAIDNGSSDACGIMSISVAPAIYTCANVGSNTVVMTVTDINGNSSTCSATVTVIDAVAPIAICQNTTLQLGSNGTGNVLATTVNNGSTDACGIGSYSLNLPTFNCSNLGANSVVLTVTDVNGNSATCSAIITVQDLVAPTAVCQNISVYLNNTGTATAFASDVNSGSSDACGIGGSGLSPSSFTCSNVGANPVILTITDFSGNMGTCSAIVTVLDTVRPQPSCNNVTVFLDNGGNASITTSQLNNNSSDVCGIGSLAASQTAFACGNVGANSVILTVTDVNGNSASCTSIVTVVDTIAPSILCPANLVLPADSSICGAIAIWNAPTVNDNCGIASINSSATSGTTFQLGQTTVMYMVVDSSGNADSCSFTVTVVASPLSATVSSPLLGCGYSVACAGDSTATITTTIAGGCLPYTYAWSNGSTSSSLLNLGAGTYTVTVTDGQGSSIVDSVTVTAPMPLTLSIVGDTLVCDGQSTGQLAALVTGGQDCSSYLYNWSTGSSSNAISNLAAGVYTVTVTDTLGCMITGVDTLQLGVLPQLDLGADTSKCPGTTLLFEAPAIYAAYLWSNGTTNSTILISSPGQYVCTVWTAGGCMDMDTVAILDYVVDNNIITPIGSLNVCDGDSVILEGDAGLTNYLWNTGSANAAITVVSQGGQFTLSANDQNGCAVADTITVNYTPFTDPMPVITPGPSAVLCNGGTLDLDVQLGYFSYAWNTGATSRSITVSAPGVYQVTVSNGFGCTRASDPVTVTIGALPTPTVTVGAGTVSTGNYATYQWFLGGNTILGAIAQVYSPVQSGYYSVFVTDSNGCSGLSDTVYFNAVGVVDVVEDLNGLTVYPNPARENLSLRTLNAIDWPVQVEVWDMFGKKVKSYDMAHLMDVFSFDISDLSSAPYLLKVTTYQRNTTQQAMLRFVKQ